MSDFYETLAARIEARFREQVTRVPSRCGELTFEVPKTALIDVTMALRDEPDFSFEQLIDV